VGSSEEDWQETAAGGPPKGFCRFDLKTFSLGPMNRGFSLRAEGIRDGHIAEERCLSQSYFPVKGVEGIKGERKSLH